MRSPAFGILLLLSFSAGTTLAGPATEEIAVNQPIDSRLFDGSGAAPRSFTKEIVIDAPTDRVFDAWASKEGWERVYAAPSAANIDLAIGGRYEWLFDGKVGSNGCQVLSYIPGRMLSFSWSAPPTIPETRDRRTWVVIETEALSENRTSLRLTHLGFGEGPQWDETYDYFDAAWGRVLEGMRSSFAE